LLKDIVSTNKKLQKKKLKKRQKHAMQVVEEEQLKEAELKK
jgi:hypothetical protein